MSRPSDRKREKKRARAIEQRKRDQLRARARAISVPAVAISSQISPASDGKTKVTYNNTLLFPKVCYAGDGPEPLVTFVKEQIAEIVAQRNELMSPEILKLFDMATRKGFDYAYTMLAFAEKRSLSPEHRKYNSFYHDFAHVLGNILFTRFTNIFWRDYFPFHDVSINYGVPYRNAISVRFRSMNSTKSDWGTAYWSPRIPKVQTSTGEVTVAFSRHAAERVCRRLATNWKTYLGMGDAFAIMHDCVYYEPWIDQHGADGFLVYDLTLFGDISWRFVEAFITEPNPDENYYFRCGYCPANRVGDLLVASTLLVPGMRGTPEREWAERHLSRRAVDELDAAAGIIDKDMEAMERLMDALRPIHDRSPLKQVRTFDFPVYDHGVQDLGNLDLYEKS